MSWENERSFSRVRPWPDYWLENPFLIFCQCATKTRLPDMNFQILKSKNNEPPPFPFWIFSSRMIPTFRISKVLALVKIFLIQSLNFKAWIACLRTDFQNSRSVQVDPGNVSTTTLKLFQTLNCSDCQCTKFVLRSPKHSNRWNEKLSALCIIRWLLIAISFQGVLFGQRMPLSVTQWAFPMKLWIC